ncbi:MAG TPA: ABC transporter permease [Stellaceae bacterium]|nr:ABC transporter permease [Stellaceae bacterium]
MSGGNPWLYRGVQVLFVAALLGLWYYVSANGIVSPILLPSMTASFAEFGHLLSTGSYWPDLDVTLYEFVCAFLLAASAGCSLGYIVSRSGFSIRVFDPLFAGLYSIPAILLFPLYVLFFGLGAGSKIAIGTTIAFFPIVLNTIAGFAYVEKAYITAARSMGASELQMFWSVMLPAAFPVVLTGLRIGFIVAFLSILGSETIASLAGLGHRIVTYAESMDPAKMFAYIFFAIIIAFLLNGGVSTLEKRVRRWQA